MLKVMQVNEHVYVSPKLLERSKAGVGLPVAFTLSQEHSQIYCVARASFWPPPVIPVGRGATASLNQALLALPRRSRGNP